jgi:hypothetical protein
MPFAHCPKAVTIATGCTSVTVVSPWRLRPRIEDRQGFATVRRRAVVGQFENRSSSQGG